MCQEGSGGPPGGGAMVRGAPQGVRGVGRGAPLRGGRGREEMVRVARKGVEGGPLRGFCPPDRYFYRYRGLKVFHRYFYRYFYVTTGKPFANYVKTGFLPFLPVFFPKCRFPHRWRVNGDP